MMDDEPKVDGSTEERPEIEMTVVKKRLPNKVRIATSVSLFDTVHSS